MSGTRLAGAGQAHGQFDELIGECLELLAIGDGGFQPRGLFSWDTAAGIGTVLPNLVFEVGAHRLARGILTILSLEAAQFHGVEVGHLAEELGSACDNFVVHAEHCLAARQVSSKTHPFFASLQKMVLHPVDSSGPH